MLEASVRTFRLLADPRVAAVYVLAAAGCGDDGSSAGQPTANDAAAIVAEQALAGVLAELAASSEPAQTVASSSHSDPKAISGFDCSLTAPVNMCMCPEGGSFTADLMAFSPSSSPCGPTAELLQTSFNFQYEGAFADCQVRLCGEDVTIDGPVVGSLSFSGNECTGASSIAGLVRTADPCDGLQVSVGSTNVTVGTNSVLSATGTSPSTTFDVDMSGDICAATFTTSFSSLENLSSQLDPGGVCGPPGPGQPGDCAMFDQSNVDFRECGFEATGEVCTFYVQFDSDTDVERTCEDHCGALGGTCLASQDESDRGTPSGQCLGSGNSFPCSETFNSVICTCLPSPLKSIGDSEGSRSRNPEQGDRRAGAKRRPFCPLGA